MYCAINEQHRAVDQYDQIHRTITGESTCIVVLLNQIYGWTIMYLPL